jgi:8-oxo-dGTP pyrophosphatase MutT (NUDIX family)
LREDNVIKPNGEKGIYGVVELPPAAGIVAMNAHHQIILVGQWRYVHNKFSWEIPTGSSEAGESILTAAKRELLEETGIEAEDWIPLGTIDKVMELPPMLAIFF